MKRISDIEERREQRKSRKVAFDNTAALGKEADRSTNVKEFSNYCNKQLLKQHDQHGKYFVLRVTETDFYVKRDYVNHDTSPEDDLELPIGVVDALLKEAEEAMVGVTPRERRAIRELKEKLVGRKKGNLPQYQMILFHVMMYVIPRFERTRVLKIVRMKDGEQVLVCSCMMWEKYGIACRHMLAVVKRHPTVVDAKIRWHTGCANNYGRNEEMSMAYSELRDKFAYPGIPITSEVKRIKKSMHVGDGDKPLGFFTNSLGKLRVRGASFWKNRMGELPRHISKCFPCSENNGGEDEVIVDTGDDRGDNQDAKPQAKAASFAHNQQVSVSSKYTVPSQSQVEAGVEDVECVVDLTGDDDVTIESQDTGVAACVQGADAYHDFMPMYKELCKMANASGHNGSSCREIMLRGMNSIRRECYGATAEPRKCSGVVSHPKLSRKMKPTRKQKVTSPPKRKRKRNR